LRRPALAAVAVIAIVSHDTLDVKQKLTPVMRKLNVGFGAIGHQSTAHPRC
jgi:hypothetical protein